jgi:hypothetical protein
VKWRRGKDFKAGSYGRFQNVNQIFVCRGRIAGSLAEIQTQQKTEAILMHHPNVGN